MTAFFVHGTALLAAPRRLDTALRHPLVFTLPAAPLRIAAASCSSSEPGDAACPLSPARLPSLPWVLPPRSAVYQCGPATSL